MSRALTLLLALACAGRAQAPVSARLISLDEAFALALKRSEALVLSQEAVNEALARVDELRASILPHLSLIGSETFQQSPNSNQSSLNNSSVPLLYITATQPLFSGFREFLAFKAGRRAAEAAQLTERRAESLLYQDVAQAYLAVLQLQNEIAIRTAIVAATRERLGQLDHWVRIGRSRESEVLAAKSQVAQFEAQVQIARGQERVAQESLRFLTGLDVDLSPRPMALPAIRPLDPYLARSRERDDVRARRKALEAARLLTSVARRQRWPSIGVTGDYYLKRAGFSANTHYDAIFGLTLPIWDGGLISAQVRENRARENEAGQSVSLAERSAQREVLSSYRSLEWSLAAAEALRKAADLAEQNLKAQEADYKLSLVTNLQVLDSLNTLETTRLQLNSAHQQAALALEQLEVAAGGPARPGEERQ